jgi:hypothetical protein
MFLFFFFFNFSRCCQNSILAIPHFFHPVRKWTTVSLLPAMVSSTELLTCFCMPYSRMPDVGCCYCCCYNCCYCWHADLLTQFVLSHSYLSYFVSDLLSNNSLCGHKQHSISIVKYVTYLRHVTKQEEGIACQVFKPLAEYSSERNSTQVCGLNSLHSESG